MRLVVKTVYDGITRQGFEEWSKRFKEGASGMIKEQAETIIEELKLVGDASLFTKDPQTNMSITSVFTLDL